MNACNSVVPPPEGPFELRYPPAPPPPPPPLELPPPPPPPMTRKSIANVVGSTVAGIGKKFGFTVPGNTEIAITKSLHH
jgi:hypothetical protein